MLLSQKEHYNIFYIVPKKHETFVPFSSPNKLRKHPAHTIKSWFLSFYPIFQFSFLTRISFPHHVFHSKPSCFLLHLAFYFSLDFILLQTIAQPLHFLGYDIQPPFFFYVHFILDLICSRNRQEALSYTFPLLKHNHIMLTCYSC